MKSDDEARLATVDRRLKVLTDKQGRDALSEAEGFELQKLLDEYEALLNRVNSEPRTD